MRPPEDPRIHVLKDGEYVKGPKDWSAPEVPMGACLSH